MQNCWKNKQQKHVKKTGKSLDFPVFLHIRSAKTRIFDVFNLLLAKDYIKDIIIQNALNLDELESTVLGLRSWYEAEDNAVSYYEAF